MRAIRLALLILLALPALAEAQPEDRQRVPTAPAAADPCAEAFSERGPGPQPAWPGFDPRVPMPRGATSFTGAAPATRDPSRSFPAPPGPTDLTYQDCRRRQGY
jgi:hypothetical protein